jgi:hypothetical protein
VLVAGSSVSEEMYLFHLEHMFLGLYFLNYVVKFVWRGPYRTFCTNGDQNEVRDQADPAKIIPQSEWLERIQICVNSGVETQVQIRSNTFKSYFGAKYFKKISRQPFEKMAPTKNRKNISTCIDVISKEREPN